MLRQTSFEIKAGFPSLSAVLSLSGHTTAQIPPRQPLLPRPPNDPSQGLAFCIGCAIIYIERIPFKQPGYSLKMTKFELILSGKNRYPGGSMFAVFSPSLSTLPFFASLSDAAKDNVASVKRARPHFGSAVEATAEAILWLSGGDIEIKTIIDRALSKMYVVTGKGNSETPYEHSEAYGHSKDECPVVGALGGQLLARYTEISDLFSGVTAKILMTENISQESTAFDEVLIAIRLTISLIELEERNVLKQRQQA